MTTPLPLFIRTLSLVLLFVHFFCLLFISLHLSSTVSLHDDVEQSRGEHSDWQLSLHLLFSIHFYHLCTVVIYILIEPSFIVDNYS